MRRNQRLSIRLVVMTLLAAIVWPLLSASVVFAQQSELYQEIQAPDCSVPNSCDMAPPTVSSVNKNNGRPIFTGYYDAAFTQRLSVTFGGRTYVLGVYGELTVNGNQWTLNLSEISSPMAEGSYTLIVSAQGFDGELLTDSTTITFEKTDVDNDPETDSDSNGVGLAETGQGILIFGAIAVTAMAGGAIYLFIIGRKRKKDNN